MDFLLTTTQDGSCNQHGKSFNANVTIPPSNPPTTPPMTPPTAPSTSPSTTPPTTSLPTPSTSPNPPKTQPDTTASPVQEKELVDTSKPEEIKADQSTNAGLESGGSSSAKVETTSFSIGYTSESTTLTGERNTLTEEKNTFTEQRNTLTEERNTPGVRKVDFIPVTHTTQPIKNEKSGEIADTENPSEQPENLEQSREVTFFPSTHSLRGEKEAAADNEVPVLESDEIVGPTNHVDPINIIGRTNKEEDDTKFGLKGISVLKVDGNEMSLDEFENKNLGGDKKKADPKNPVAERGKFQKRQIDDKNNEHQISKEVMKRPENDPEKKNDNSQEVDKGYMVSQELLERSVEGGADYNENQIDPKEEETTGKEGYEIEKKMMNRPGYIEVPRVIHHYSFNIHRISGT